MFVHYYCLKEEMQGTHSLGFYYTIQLPLGTHSGEHLKLTEDEELAVIVLLPASIKTDTLPPTGMTNKTD